VNTVLPGTPGLDDDLSELEDRFRRRQMSRFAPETLLWLAAMPEWTDRLASSAGFPTGKDSPPVTELIPRLRAAGLLETRQDTDADGDEVTAFWLPASRRAGVGEQLRGEWGNPEILDRLRRLAGALQRLSPQQVDPVRSWLEFAEHYLAGQSTGRTVTTGDPSGTELLADVDGLLAESRAIDALSLVGIAQALGDVLGEPLASSARRAQWRIDRGYRQALDASSLRHYQPRPEVEGSIGDLVLGHESCWAVHLLGEGGVGKTMAIRDLCSGQFFRRAGIEPLPVARVDFDHLDPRYPQGRPGELLLALIGDLTTYTTTRDIERRLRRSDDAITRLHEAVASSTAAHLETELLNDAIGAFADYLDGFGRPVVLVLDTCEELAKLHPPGGRAPAVDQTFLLLERIHEIAPGVRALLAGRRWLVPPPPSAGRSSGGLELDPRDYLHVVPVEGFSPEQARQYIDRRDPEARLSPELRRALLDRSAKPGTVGADGPGAADINPFDLACYCDWALAEPGLDADELRNAPGDPYVEQRIIARLSSSEVRDCLPVAVELGRFDRTMIEPELQRRGIDLDEAFSGLVGQEWVSAVTFGDAGQPAVIEVDEQLRPRLRAVIEARPARFPLDRARLGRDLARLVTDSPLSELTVEAIEAAIRLLPPAGAATMWARLEDRLTNTPGEWSWAGQATARAAAVEAQRAAEEGPTILAAILATQAAAVLRQPGRPGVRALWEQVQRLTARHPDPATARRLRFRALCFLVEPSDEAGLQELVQMWRDHRGELPEGSILAKIDAHTATGAPLATNLAMVLEDLCQSPKPSIAISARLARASSAQVRGDFNAAAAEVDTVLRLLEAGTPGLSHWADWDPPAGILDRARLARLALAVARSEPPEHFPLADWQAAALSRTGDIDGERLAAATIMLELCWRQTDPATLNWALAGDIYNPVRQPTNPWHRSTPMLCAAIALALAAAGDAQGAANLLRNRRKAALSQGEDPLTVEACDELLARLSRAFRTTKLTASIPRIAREGGYAAREHAWSALALVDGESPASPAETGDPRIWWRTQIIRPDELFTAKPSDTGASTEAFELFLIHGGMAPLPSYPWPDTGMARRRVERGLAVVRGEAVDLAAALREEALLDGLRPWSRVLGLPPQLVAETALSEAADKALVLGDAADLAAALREEALLDGLRPWSRRFGGLPPRLVAETALSEAELMALRLPEVALRLLDAAFNRADAAGDHILAGRAAVLLVLVTARAGGDLQSVSIAHREAMRTFLPEDDEVSGWPTRLDLAQALLAGSPLPVSSLHQISPELDPRPVRRAPPAEAVPPTGTEPASTQDIRGVAAVERPQPPPPPALAQREPPESLLLTGSGTPEMAPASGAPRRGCLISVLVSLALAGVGLLAASQLAATGVWQIIALVFAALCLLPLLGYGIDQVVGAGQSRSDYPTILFGRAVGDAPGMCRFKAVGPEVTIEPQARPAPPARFRRQYLVIPLIGRDDTGEGAEKLLAAEAASLIGKQRVLFVRFRRGGLPLSWRLWDRQPSHRNKIAAEYQGPPSIRPLGIGRRADPSARWCTVLHAVGTPVQTHAGWRLRVAATSSSSSERYVKSGSRTYEGEELLGPDELLARRTALVVLQAEPVDRRPQPLGEQYAGMHGLAAELRDGGAGAVLVVPPVPEAVASEVAQRILDAMTRHGYETRPVHILDLADSVRNLIAGNEPARVRPRASWDVLLLVRT
jgi:hypothetical protein